MHSRTEKTIRQIEQILKSNVDIEKYNRNKSHYSPFSCYLSPRANLYNQYPLRTPVSSKRLKKSIKKAKSKTSTKKLIPKPFLLNNLNEEYHQLSNSAKKAFTSTNSVKSQSVQTSLALILDQSDSSNDPITFIQKNIKHLIKSLDKLIMKSFFNRWKQRWFYRTAYTAQKFIKSSPMNSTKRINQSSENSYTEEYSFYSEDSGSMNGENSINARYKNGSKQLRNTPKSKRSATARYNSASPDDFEPEWKQRRTQTSILNARMNDFGTNTTQTLPINDKRNKTITFQDKNAYHKNVYNSVSSEIDSDLNMDYNDNKQSQKDYYSQNMIKDNGIPKNDTKKLDKMEMIEINQSKRRIKQSYKDDNEDEDVDSPYNKKLNNRNFTNENVSKSPHKSKHQKSFNSNQNEEYYELITNQDGMYNGDKGNTRHIKSNSSYYQSQSLDRPSQICNKKIANDGNELDSENEIQARRSRQNTNKINQERSTRTHSRHKENNSGLYADYDSDNEENQGGQTYQNNSSLNQDFSADTHRRRSKYSIDEENNSQLKYQQRSSRNASFNMHDSSHRKSLGESQDISYKSHRQKDMSNRSRDQKSLYKENNGIHNVQQYDNNYSNNLENQNSEIEDENFYDERSNIQSDDEIQYNRKSSDANAISPIIAPVDGPDELISQIIPDLDKFVSKYSNSVTYNWSIEDESDADFKKLVEKSRYYSTKYSTSTIEITESTQKTNTNNTSTIEYPDLIPVNTNLSIHDQNDDTYIPELHEFDNERPNPATNSPPIYK